MTKRHAAIQTFQSTGSGGHLYPNGVIFVITLAAGACGITLTAASRVYLMEPALDPAAEQQAAGRVHRLGQTSAVTIKRFLYRKTVEERIGRMHEKIKAGTVRIVVSVCGGG